MSKRIVIAGSTGLTGKALLQKVKNDSFFTLIYTLVRFKSIKVVPRVSEVLVDFNTIKQLPEADILAICIGTTRKKAGSKEAFRKVDYNYVARLAQLAKTEGYEKVIVISSYGAKATSGNFYLNVKGEMEDKLKTLNLNACGIVRPSLILGNRNEFRFGESLAVFFMKVLMPLLKGGILRYRPVQETQVADAIIKLAKEPFRGTKIVGPEWIHKNT